LGGTLIKGGAINPILIRLRSPQDQQGPLHV
jgi:hypothetical protein